MPNALAGVEGPSQTNFPLSNAFNDIPSMLWASPTGSTQSYIIVENTRPWYEIDKGAFDTVVFISGTFVTVRIRTGDTPTGVGVYDSGELPWREPTNPSGYYMTKSSYRIPAQTARYVRIDFTRASSGAMNLRRLVIGKAMPLGTTGGLDIGAEMSWVDDSIVYSGPQYEFFDQGQTYPQYKVSVSFIDQADFETWSSNLAVIGKTRAVFFAPDDDPQSHHRFSAFGRIQNVATATMQASGTWKIEFVIRSLVV
ncbi:hypothetical protein GRI62_11905 [Erythrobacter arachoides]|uniref:Uncharacterized protein n=1 Tax=Aurantiacibacter arachoides TaxID=1850444 RepID=A0A845A3S7_9SPHN|nr:hypothetical protein [Aurantiacibacter arachoides]MXO94300.1 hypothetical protein [Aurantiacibacter arachoides]